jgi:hypothetical protein
MRAADQPLHLVGHVDLGGVQRQVGPQLLCQGQLVVVDVHRRHMQTHRLGILHRHVPQATDPRNRDPLSRTRLGLLQALVDRDPGAQHRRGIAEVQPVGQAADVVRIGAHEFGIAAVHAVARVLLAFAQRFPPADAMFAVTAGGVQPRRADAVAFLQVCHAPADGGHFAHAFVARYEGRVRFHRPVAHGGMQIGVANARGADADQDLTGADLWHRHLANVERTAEGGDNGGLHRAGKGHAGSPALRTRQSVILS